MPYYPALTGGHRWHAIDDAIEPKCVSGDFMRQQLVDVLVNEDALEEDAEDSDG